MERGGSGVGREWGLQSALITHFAASDCCRDCCRVCCYARYSCCCCCCFWRFVAVIINNIFIINVLWRRSSVVASVAANHLPQDRAQLHFIIYSTCALSNLPHGGAMPTPTFSPLPTWSLLINSVRSSALLSLLLLSI